MNLSILQKMIPSVQVTSLCRGHHVMSISCMLNSHQHHKYDGQGTVLVPNGALAYKNLPVCSNRKHFNISRQKLLNCRHLPYVDKPTKNYSLVQHSDSLLRSHGDDKNIDRHFGHSTKRILAASPQLLQPYLRLIRFDKPIGTFLLFWPCTWSMGLAAQAGCMPDFYLLSLFALGSFFMRGAGCIINDMWDKDFDKRVTRTKSRPLASGELSLFQGLVFLGGNLSVALAILLQLNLYSVVLGVASMGLVILYPLAKRYTYWPQIMLGLTFNYGAMLGWCAVNGSVAWPILPLYGCCLLWTLVYDTIYAHQDKYDDMLIGVKSTALLLGDKTKPVLSVFSALMVSNLALSGYLCDQTWPFYTVVTATAAHLAWQLYTVELNEPDQCFAKFKSNSGLGLMIFLGIVLGNLLKPTVKDDTLKDDDAVISKHTC